MTKVDVAQRMQEIRDRVRREREQREALPLADESRTEIAPPPPPPTAVNLSALRQYVQEVNQKWAVQERPFVSRVPLFGPFIAWFREQWNRVSAKWYVLLILQQQVDFNLSVTRACNELAQMAEQLHSRMTQMQDALTERDTKQQAWQEATSRQIVQQGAWQEETTRNLTTLSSRLQQFEEQAGRLLLQYQQIERQGRELQERLTELADQQKEERRFYRGLLKELAGATIGSAATRDTGHAGAQASAERAEALPPSYLDFNRLFTGRDRVIAGMYERYLPFFSGCHNVLDVGAGRGVFLELLAEHGIGGYGIDTDEEMITLCLGKGLRVYQAAALDHLRSLEDEALDGVFMGHLVEHLPFPDLLELLHLTYRKLKPGGYLVLETPNTRSLFVLSQTFYRDPTHSQPIHPETYEFLVRSQGFEQVELQYSNPVPPGLRPVVPTREGESLADPLAATVHTLGDGLEALSEFVYGQQNVAVIARRRP